MRPVTLGRHDALSSTHPAAAVASTSGRGISWTPLHHRRGASSHRHGADQDRTRSVLVRDQQPHEFSMWRTALPGVPSNLLNVVPGAKTVATQLLSAEKVIERMRAGVHENAARNYGAFYSSELGGIVTDPAFMMVHLDDHMVHRGHAVFDTALITEGYLYQLPEHIARFKNSAAAAGLELPVSDAGLTRILLDTAAASKRLNGMVRYYLSSGRGGFALSDRECDMVSLYAIATSGTGKHDRLVGWTACISSVPLKPPPFCTLKSTNYLPNALVMVEAEALGYDLGLFVDEGGFIQEGPNYNVAIVTQEDVLVVPPMDNILDGITMRRLLELLPEELLCSPNDLVISRVERRPISQEDVLAAKEMFATSSGIQVMPIISLDGEIIGDGTPGTIALGLHMMLKNDMVPLEGSLNHIAIPYGFMTGLKDELV